MTELLNRDAVSSHRDDEARELERIRTWLADHDALDGAVADSAIELFEALTRSIREEPEAYARSVSDVVELVRFRGPGNIRTTSKEQASEDMADFIEKWERGR